MAASTTSRSFLRGKSSIAACFTGVCDQWFLRWKERRWTVDSACLPIVLLSVKHIFLWAGVTITYLFLTKTNSDLLGGAKIVPCLGFLGYCLSASKCRELLYFLQGFSHRHTWGDLMQCLRRCDQYILKSTRLPFLSWQSRVSRFQRILSGYATPRHFQNWCQTPSHFLVSKLLGFDSRYFRLSVRFWGPVCLFEGRHFPAKVPSSGCWWRSQSVKVLGSCLCVKVNLTKSYQLYFGLCRQWQQRTYL